MPLLQHQAETGLNQALPGCRQQRGSSLRSRWLLTDRWGRRGGRAGRRWGRLAAGRHTSTSRDRAGASVRAGCTTWTKRRHTSRQAKQTTHTHNRLTAGTTRVGRYQKKHSPTHTHPLSSSSIYNDSWHPLKWQKNLKLTELFLIATIGS